MQSILKKIQLYLFLLLAIINTYYFFYKATLSDSFLHISLNNIEAGYLSYLFNSIIDIVGFYVGYWEVVLFAFTAIYFSLSNEKNRNRFSFVLPILLIPFSIYLFYIIAPGMLGLGLIDVVDSIPSIVGFGLFLLSFSGALLIITNHTPKEFGQIAISTFEFIRNRRTKLSNDNSEQAEFNGFDGTINGQEHEEDDTFDTSKSDSHVNNFEKMLIPLAPLLENHSKSQSPIDENRRESKNVMDGDYEVNNLISLISNSNRVKNVEGPDSDYFSSISQSIEEKLLEFNIHAKIINVLKGPVVDTFELELGSGVKVSKVTSITEDLSLALSGAPIRLVYPLKGKTTMGIEVPRNPREIIFLDEVLNTKSFIQSNMRLPIAMGKDAFGNAAVVDLAGMPHMLVAGATGAGKSVFINTLLVSLLVKQSPQKLKLILIDPKQLELALYSNLPHLLLPVMTEAKSASLALMWVVQEMERRYSILKEFAVRNIEGFNKKLSYANLVEREKIQHFYKEDEDFELPYIVVIVDEFADLILTKTGKEIEMNICRLAAKARAAGIHLVIATQRPSVDVITGLIKSNFPTRVSFRVTTNVDSRTILSAIGAEKLLGMGDMLYKHGIDMARLHSAYVSEDEIESLMEKLSSFPRSFSTAATEFVDSGGTVEDIGGGSSFNTSFEDSSNGNDAELYREAIRIVAEYRVASASMLQRRLRIGYNRAANLIEEMEKNGIVGPQQGSKPRKVLISKEETL